MAPSKTEFLRRLQKSGLLELDDALTAAVVDASSTAGLDAAGLAKELVKRKQLTRFQAAALYQNKTRHLMLGNYVLLSRIGEGGMGQVFKARHQRMDRIVAVKLIPADKLRSDATRQRFQREARAVAKLDHPNIVRAFDADSEQDISFLVMEYVEGQDLETLLRTQGRLAPEVAVNYAIQAARHGLQYAHSQGVIHRDIKPANLLVGNDGNVKILDMGLARFEDTNDESHLTKAGEIMGTIDYIPPEQIDNRVDSRGDTYSLGCTLFRLVTGSKPYNEETVMKQLLAHRDAPIPLLTDHREDVPPQLVQICQRMLAKNPDDRYQSMNQLIVALEMIGTGDSSVIDLSAVPPADDLQSFLNHMSVEIDGTPRGGSSKNVAMETLVDTHTTTSPVLDRVRHSGGNRLYFVISGILVLLLVLIAIGLVMLTRPSGDDEGEPTPAPGVVIDEPASDASE